jgi:hypothetical protein
MYEIIIIILIAAIAYLFYTKESNEKKYEEKMNKIIASLESKPSQIGGIIDDQILTKQLAQARIEDTLLAPEIRGPFPIANSGVAINQNPRILPGQYVNDPEYLSYQQVGFLNNNEGDKPTILPLFGKKKYPRSDQWEYYYQTDKYNQIKIPIEYKKNYALMSKDVIKIPEYNKDFVVTIYDYDAPKYIPYVV